MAHTTHPPLRSLLTEVIPAVFALTIFGQPIPAGDEAAALLAIGPSMAPLAILPRRLTDRWCVKAVGVPANVGNPTASRSDPVPVPVMEIDARELPVYEDMLVLLPDGILATLAVYLTDMPDSAAIPGAWTVLRLPGRLTLRLSLVA